MNEDPRYLAAIEYEYLCESFDRRQEGSFNKYGDYMPHCMLKSCRFSIEKSWLVAKKHDLKFHQFKNFLNPRMTFERIEQEYKRLIEPHNITIKLQKADD
tara:strand:- start:1295 stop:1594 length:300 start_codon:yes stop_codon:yes gene_type:complete